jgi:hypothetical protein
VEGQVDRGKKNLKEREREGREEVERLVGRGWREEKGDRARTSVKGKGVW